MAYVRKIHTVAETIWKVTFFLPLDSSLPLPAISRSLLRWLTTLVPFFDDLNENEPLSLVTSSTYASIFVTTFFASFIVHSLLLSSFLFLFFPLLGRSLLILVLPLSERGWLIFAHFLAMPQYPFENNVLVDLLLGWKNLFPLPCPVNWYLFVSYVAFYAGVWFLLNFIDVSIPIFVFIDFYNTWIRYSTCLYYY